MECWLCLAGGNALGAFYVGAWSAIERSRLDVTRICGASIGAVVAAVVGGNAPERREEALSDFLKAVAQTPPFWAADGRRALVTSTLFRGNPSLFGPSMPGLLELLPFVPPGVSLFKRDSMLRLLERSIDFERLNDCPIEITFTALDAETGEVVAFRNRNERLTVDHIMASTALPGLFRPITIAGRTYFDPGLCENLPLPAMLDRGGEAAILALDLFPLARNLKPTLNGVAGRAQNLAFAAQSARVIEQCDVERRRFTHLVLDDPQDDFAGKAFDFSVKSLERRRQLGEDLTEGHLQGWLQEGAE